MTARCFFIMVQGSDYRCGRFTLTNLRERNLGIVPAGGCLVKAALTDVASNLKIKRDQEKAGQTGGGPRKWMAADLGRLL